MNADKPDWEATLPESIKKDIAALLKGEEEKPSYLDCLYDELYGSINANYWGGCITAEQADYLRKKYLFAPDEDEAGQSQRLL